ncbi:MAG TPA: hypothetical protein VEU96_09725 [Bryobacteraceae bacterium]|nr:hypothetical protein [Bryobacteraceae bacterium]
MTDTIAPNGHDTTRQTKANQANSKLSTGPKTEAGKARSAQNALQHGLTARAIVLPTEDPAAFESHIQKLLDEYQPKTPTEADLVKALAGATWHLHRIDKIEIALFSEAQQDSDLTRQFRSLAILSMHRHRLSRQCELTRKELRDLQSDRRHAEKQQMEKAADLLEMDKEKGVPFDPVDNGFVFSTTEIETYIRRRDRAEEAKDAMIEREYRRNHPDEDEDDEE